MVWEWESAGYGPEVGEADRLDVDGGDGVEVADAGRLGFEVILDVIEEPLPGLAVLLELAAFLVVGEVDLELVFVDVLAELGEHAALLVLEDLP